VPPNYTGIHLFIQGVKGKEMVGDNSRVGNYSAIKSISN
jgi:hypothetical protein